MPADIDVLVAGSSPISFTPKYQFEPEVHAYDVPSTILNSENPDLSYGSSSNRLDFAAALSSSPTSNSYLNRGPATHFTFHGRCSSPTLRSVPPASPTSFARNFNHLRLAPCKNSGKMPVAVPRRPCLVVRCDVLDLGTSNKSKKKVVFADDRGFPLELVRTMTEPSNVPPQLNFPFLEETHQENSKEVHEPWEVAFPQPASDYLDFRRRLDTGNVSLENVIIKESEEVVLGTIKVRNLSFHKEVFVRMTADNWKTQKDVIGTYVPNSPPAHGVTILYDTFSFRLALPSESRKIEFCVCFKCSGSEYWDNNNGKNYLIVRKETPIKPSILVQPGYAANGLIKLTRSFNDDVKSNTQLESWSEFASWNHLNNSTPYW